MREGKNMGIMTTFKKPTLERGARGDHRRGGLRRALARGQQQRHRHGRRGAFQKGPSCVTVYSSFHMHFHPDLSVSSSS